MLSLFLWVYRHGQLWTVYDLAHAKQYDLEEAGGRLDLNVIYLDLSPGAGVTKPSVLGWRTVATVPLPAVVVATSILPISWVVWWLRRPRDQSRGFPVLDPSDQDSDT